MKLALYTNIISPHQLPLARELMSVHPEIEFRYVYTQGLPPDAAKRGWEWHESPTWIVSAEKEPGRARQILDEADVVLSGERDLALFERRHRAGKKTLYMSERWFKPLRIGGEKRWTAVLPGVLRLLVPGYRKMAKRFVKWTNGDPGARVLAIGPWAKKDFLRLGVPAEKIVPWAYFVEPSDSSTPRHLSIQTPKPLSVLWVGRMLELKRVDTIIKAVRMLDDIKVSLTLVGAGPEEDRLRKLAKGMANVKFLPGVPIAEVRRLMRENDVYVFASNGMDGWGAVVNEALEEGMIVLGTHETGASATMLPEEYRFPAGNVRKLFELIVQTEQGKLKPIGIGDWSVRRGVDKLMGLVQ